MSETAARPGATEVDWHAPGELELTPILRAALEAFYENGYHGTSVRDIARRVGVTVPALYYHHENKEAILFSLLETSIDRILGLCDAALADAGPEPESRLLNLVECLVVYMANVGRSANLDAEIRALSAERRAVYVGKRAAIETFLIDVIVAGNASGAFDVTHPVDTARALLGMYQAIPTWFSPGGRLTASDLARRYKDISAHAVGASPELVARARA